MAFAKQAKHKTLCIDFAFTYADQVQRDFKAFKAFYTEEQAKQKAKPVRKE
ncbi:MAG: hypothetical protein JST26_05400 [Bacteroidetes bacterium]|nr:hypothetical protein [Bacteroidota bacterium]